MNDKRLIRIAVLLIVMLTFTGCKSKQDKPAAGGGTPQEKVAAQAPDQDKAGVSAVPAQDRSGAQKAAAQVLAQLEAGDFAGIYKGAAPGFKNIGSESQFVAKFQQTRQRVGVLKNPQAISAAMLPDKSIVLVYRMENERYNTDMRLTFSRAASGAMELAGLNQHDELKK